MADVTPIAVIQQGAQYYLPFKISLNGTVTSPQNVDDLWIKLDDKTWKYSDGSLRYSGQNWIVPLKQVWTMGRSNKIAMQASIKRGDDVFPSDVYPVKVAKSSIQELF